VTEAQEALLGEEGYREIMSQYRGRILPDAHPQVRVIKGVLTNLINAARTYDSRVGEFKWELHVVHDPQKNAFVLPGYVHHISIPG
jgi:predicted Zn-dependent protease